MIRFGRYRIYSGCTFWLQTPPQVVIKRFLFLWITKEANLAVADKKAQFSPGTMLHHEGRKYKYVRAVDNTHVDDGGSSC